MGRQGAAFAAMLEQIKVIRTVSYTTTVMIDDNHVLTSETSLLEPGWIRDKLKIADMECVVLFNFQEGKGLSLLPAMKLAALLDVADDGEKYQQKHVIEDLSKLPKESAEFVGQEEVDGISALKYQVNLQGEYRTVWIDPESNLPVKVVASNVADPR